MHWTTVTLAAAIALAPAMPAAAQAVPTRVTGKALVTVCGENRVACMTYVTGAVDAVVATIVTRDKRNPLCLPPGTTNNQLAEATVRYLRAHPEKGDTNAAILVVMALLEAYPCSKK